MASNAYPTNQGAGYAASVPMWQVTSPSVADAQGRFPCDPSNPNAARPVYEVAPPVYIDSGCIRMIKAIR